MPICRKCRAEKPDEEFSWRQKNRGVRQPECVLCTRARAQDHYNRNRQRYLEKALVEGEKRRALLKTLKQRCVDCGNTNFVVLEFHHLDPTAKEGSIATMAISRIVEEAKKCVVLCANCHRIRHWQERQKKKANASVAQLDRAPRYERGHGAGSTPVGGSIPDTALGRAGRSKPQKPGSIPGVSPTTRSRGATGQARDFPRVEVARSNRAGIAITNAPLAETGRRAGFKPRFLASAGSSPAWRTSWMLERAWRKW